MKFDNREERCWSIETRAKTNEEGEIIGMFGEAAVVGVRSEDLGGFYEEMEEGAFEDADITDVIAKLNHDDNMVLGRTNATPNPTLEVTPHEKGLSYSIPDIAPTTYGNNLKIHLKRGEIKKSSFAFTLKSKERGDTINGYRWSRDDTGKRIATIVRGGIKKVYDVSPVWAPAYSQATVSPVTQRSLDKFKAETENIKDNYFKVVVSENNDVPEILLYGFIGQDFWWDEDLKEESITDISFKKELNRLEKDHKRINIRINSPGGSMYHGNAIISAIQSSKAEIHIYNDGMAASMATDIWLSADNDKRHMADNALVMVHPPSSIIWGTAEEMRKEADVLDKFEHTAIVVMEKACDLSYDEVKDQFYDGEDHWLTAEECKELGLISKVEDYQTQKPMADNENPTQEKAMKHFADEGDAMAKRWLQAKTNIELRKSKVEEMQKRNNDSEKEITVKIDADITPLEDKIKKAEQLVEDFKEKHEETIITVNENIEEKQQENKELPTESEIKNEEQVESNEAAKAELLQKAEEAEVDAEIKDMEVTLLKLKGELL